jgi:hypothetical protein
MAIEPAVLAVEDCAERLGQPRAAAVAEGVAAQQRRDAASEVATDGRIGLTASGGHDHGLSGERQTSAGVLDGGGHTVGDAISIGDARVAEYAPPAPLDVARDLEERGRQIEVLRLTATAARERFECSAVPLQPGDRVGEVLDDDVAVALEATRILAAQKLAINDGPEIAVGEGRRTADGRGALDDEHAGAALRGCGGRTHACQAGSENKHVESRVRSAL